MSPHLFKALTSRICELIDDTRGSVVVTLAFALPVAILGVAAATDYAYMHLRRSEMQSAVDAAALNGARELMLANADEKAITSLARGTVAENLENAEGIEVTATVSPADRSVEVVARQSHRFFVMGDLAGLSDSGIETRATAKVAGGMPVCMLLLHPSDTASLALNNSARITGNRCAIQANSTSSRAILASNGAKLSSELTCTGGGYHGDEGSFDPVPLIDCAPLDDPLAHRRSPPDETCTRKSAKLTKDTHTLGPGTYCGGLDIGGTARVKLLPGVYTIKDGGFTIGGQARVSGEHVGFFLTGKGATFNFMPQTTIDLSAPKDGPLAGILFFESRQSGPTRRYVIRSNGARSFVGTIYLPFGDLVIDAVKPVFEDSAYTVVIAQRMTMFSGPHLILNSDYENSDIPVPEELNHMTQHGKNVVLTK